MAMNFRDDIPSTPIEKFKDTFVIVFHLSTIQDAVEKWPHPELDGELLKLGLCLNYPPQHVTKLLVLGKRVSFFAVVTSCVV